MGKAEIHYALLETPCEVTKLFQTPLDEKPHFGTEEIHEALEKHFHGDNLEGKRFLYLPDRNIFNNLSELDKEDDTVLGIFLDNMRKKVKEWLQHKGGIVLQFDQSFRPFLDKGSPFPLQHYWQTAITGDVNKTCKVSKIIDADDVLEIHEAFDHPNIARERQFKLKNDLLLVVAPNYSELPTLDKLITILPLRQRIKILLDGMCGCSFLHQQGFAHLDPKIGNVLVEETEEGFKGMLYDLEGILPLHSQCKQTTYSLNYCEDFYYFLGKGERYPIDQARDVFSFGINLLIAALGANISEKLEDLRGECWKLKNSKKQEEILFRFIDEVWSFDLPEGLKKIIKRMLSADRQTRPTLQETIAEVEKIMTENSD